MNNMKKLFVALVLYEYNLLVLHWNAKGKHFDNTHDKLTDLYKYTIDAKDDVAEIMLLSGECKPLCLQCCLDFAKEDSDSYCIIECGDDLDTKETWKCVKYMFEHLAKLFEDACNDITHGNGIKSKLDEHQYFYTKEARYKADARLK